MTIGRMEPPAESLIQSFSSTMAAEAGKVHRPVRWRERMQGERHARAEQLRIHHWKAKRTMEKSSSSTSSPRICTRC